MPEIIQRLLNRVLEWWNKFTTKQKTMIIAVGSGVIMAIALVITMLSQTQYVLLLACEDTKQANEVRTLLDGASIEYKISDDGLRIEIDETRKWEANLLLGENDIQSTVYSIENVVGGGFGTTEANTQRLYKVYLEGQFTELAMSLSAVRSAKVVLDIPEETYGLLDEQKEKSASVILTLESEFSEENASSLARAISVGLGNKSTENVTIMDTQGNMLYSGNDTYSTAGSASSQLSAKSKYETSLHNAVRKVLLGTSEYNQIEVASNLVLNFSTQTETSHEYSPPEGQEQGGVAHEEIYDGSSTNGVGGIPGTDSNDDENSYQYLDTSESESSESERVTDYLWNERIVNLENPPGTIDYSQSSIAVTAKKFVLIQEEEVDARGELDTVSWEEYQAANSAPQTIEVTDEIYDIVSKSTGIAVENISIMATSENIFYDAEGLNIAWQDIAVIAIIAAFLLMAAFIVLQVMRSNREVVEEEELSVESLLQSQPEVELEDINIDEGSEAKRLIDKFVEDNPEAAAALLRNWLNEEWA